MLRLTDVVKHLLVINVLVFIASEFLGLTDLLALHYPASDKFMPLQIVTHFFMHGGFAHIFFNMFALVMFGSALETLWGPKKFLFFYFVCAFGAAALHMGVSYWDFSQMQAMIDTFKENPTYENYWRFFEDVPFDILIPEYQNAVNQVAGLLEQGNQQMASRGAQLMERYLDNQIDIPIVGASGAIYGLLLAFGMKFPNAELMLIFLPIPIKAKYFIPILMVVELVLGVNRFSWDNIAHFAHLGGAITGLLLILYWRKFGSRFDEKRW